MKRNILRKVGWACVIALGLSFIAGRYLSTALPYSLDEIRDNTNRTDTIITARNGEVLDIIRTDFSKRLFVWTEYRQLPTFFGTMLIEAEDKRFTRHLGVDIRSLFGAALATATGKRRGGSTLTMQLVNLISDEPGRNISKKLWQIFGATVLEQRLSKDEILEAYLNLAPFRGENVGVAAAAWSLFRKAPSGLTEDEAAILIAHLPAPNQSWTPIKARACRILKQREKGCDAVESWNPEASNEKISSPLSPELAPHAARKLLKSNGASAIIQSTLDASLQRAVTDLLQARLSPLRAQRVQDGAVIVLDNDTGETLVYIGGRGEKSSARSIDGVQMRRQAGSTLKPFLYASAFDQRILTPETRIDDSAADFVLGTAVYRPKNYDSKFWGPISARSALGSSRNVPAVKVLDLIGVGRAVDILKAAGFTELNSAEHYGPSLALGSASVSLAELTNGYRIFANGGVFSLPKLSSTEENEKRDSARIFSAGASFLISSVLSDREARALAFGYSSPLDTSVWSAAKTGTSRDMTDNWCVGYSSRFTVGVWVGNLHGESMLNVSGIDGAAPIWSDIMQLLHTRIGSTQPPVPGEVVVKNDERGIPRYFLAGTEDAVSIGSTEENPKIIYPPNGLVLGFDSDIGANQKLPIKISKAAVGLSVQIGSETFDVKDGPVLWSVRPGSYRAKLLRKGHVIDSAGFVVRPKDRALGDPHAGVGGHEVLQPDDSLAEPEK